MSAAKSSKSKILSGLLSFVGMSALAALLIAAAVTPAVAITGVTANSTLGIFDGLPGYLEINNLAQKSSIYAKTSDGKDVLLASFYAQNRVTVPLDQISPYVKDGAIATEDPRFYEHGGIDLIGTARAFLANATGGNVQGGSSITQQYVKNILVMRAEEISDPEKRKEAYAAATETSIGRKLKELKLAIGVEQKYDKDEILNGYLNIASFGGRVYGIEAAAEYYYGVKAKDLTLAQAASLVATVNNPNNLRIDIPDNIKANTDRRNYVLSRMLAEGKITQQEYDKAVAEPVTPKLTQAATGCQTAGNAAYFCDYVTWIIKNDPTFGATEDDRWTAFQRGGLKIYTSLNLDVQAATQQALDERVAHSYETGDFAATSVSIQVGTGRVLAMGQSKDYSADPEVTNSNPNYTSVNFNTDSTYGSSGGFPVGSTYKLFTLAEWLKSGHGLGEMINGSTKTWKMSEFKDSCEGVGGPDWTPTNYAGGGTTAPVLTSLINSWNTNFVMMASKLDLCNIRKTAESFLVHKADGSKLKENPATVLGTEEIAPMSMAVAVAGIADQGLTCTPIAIDKITDRDGKDIAVPKTKCSQAVPAEVANTMAYAMEQVPTGTASASRIGDGVPYIAKTGTSDNSEHNWMLGATTAVSTAVWLGNVTGHTSVRDEFGGNYYQVAQTIWAQIMAVANGIYGGNPFPGPDPKMLTGKGVTAPAINGLTLEQAKTMIESMGFGFEDGGAIDGYQPVGTVIKSDPESGASTAVGAKITVFTSNAKMKPGPGTTVGMDYLAAKAQLQSQGWKVTIAWLAAPEIPCPDPSPSQSSSTGPSTPPQPAQKCYDDNPANRYQVVTQSVVGGYWNPANAITLKVQGPQ